MRLLTSIGVFSRVRRCFVLFKPRSWYFGHHISSSDRLKISIIQPLGELVGINEMELQSINGGTRKNGHHCAVPDEDQQRHDRLSVLRIYQPPLSWLRKRGWMHFSQNPTLLTRLGLRFRLGLIANDLMLLGQQIIWLDQNLFLFPTVCFFFDI